MRVGPIGPEKLVGRSRWKMLLYKIGITDSRLLFDIKDSAEQKPL